MSGKILHPIQRACQHGNPQCARLKIRGSFILRPVYPPRSYRSLMAKISVNSTTKAITPKPIITAVDHDEIGRASGRERVCQYVKSSVVAVSLKKQNKNH